jgi:hypothetical protein
MRLCAHSPSVRLTKASLTSLVLDDQRRVDLLDVLWLG